MIRFDNVEDYEWIPLDVAQGLVITKRAHDSVGVLSEARKYSIWLTDAGFRGLQFMGRPTWHFKAGISPGSMKIIPVHYFRKERSFYGSYGIGGLPFLETFDPENLAPLRKLEEDMLATEENGIFDESDWEEVLVKSDQLITMIGGKPAKGVSPPPSSVVPLPPMPNPSKTRQSKVWRDLSAAYPNGYEAMPLRALAREIDNHRKFLLKDNRAALRSFKPTSHQTLDRLLKSQAAS